MSLADERMPYLSLEQIERVCREVAARLLVDGGGLVEALQRALTAISANGLRSSALRQGLFGAHAARPGVIAIAGPGGVGKTYLAELRGRVTYGERFADHLIVVNCRAYFAGRFPPLPRAKLEAGPLCVVALDGVEALPEIPPVAALWSDAIRYGRAALPATVDQGPPSQQELAFGRCLIVATANVAREQTAHIGFRPGQAEPVEREAAARLIREALATLFDAGLADAFPLDRWIVLPPLDEAGMRRLVDLELASLAELLPRSSPPIEIDEPAATALIQAALRSRSPNKTAALVDLIEAVVEPPVNAALLRAAAPAPLRVRIALEAGRPRATVE